MISPKCGSPTASYKGALLTFYKASRGRSRRR